LYFSLSCKNTQTHPILKCLELVCQYKYLTFCNLHSNKQKKYDPKHQFPRTANNYRSLEHGMRKKGIQDRQYEDQIRRILAVLPQIQGKFKQLKPLKSKHTADNVKS
jgi:hypothetical protein